MGCILLAGVLGLACGHVGAVAAQPLEPGEIARLHVTASIGQEIVFATTRPELLASPLVRTAAWFEAPSDPEPILILVGEPTALPGLGRAAVGMSPGERQEVRIPPAEAYGPRDSALVESLPRAQHLRRAMAIGPRQFIERFERFPVVGETYVLDELIQAEVVRVEAEEAMLRLVPRQPLQRETAAGLTEIRATDEEIIIQVSPRLGAAWSSREGREGRVIAVEESSFQIDFNHPLAGKAVTYDIEVLERLSPESLAGLSYPWRDDHDAALQAARKARRPVFLLLCATWCTWTEELLVGTLEDPQIKVFRDRFVWVQIESDIHAEYRKRYGQTGSPMIVLINARGEITYQKQGFREAPELRAALLECLRSG